jgi:hypothetical protein
VEKQFGRPETRMAMDFQLTLELDDLCKEVTGHEWVLELPEEGLEDDGGDVHVAVLKHDLLAAVDFGLEGMKRKSKNNVKKKTLI